MTATLPSALHLGLDDTIVTAEFTIGCMSTLDRTGDTRVMWDSRNEQEVAAAKAQFDSLRAQGFLAYKAEGKKGTRGEVIRDFDPSAERIILVAPLVGG